MINEIELVRDIIYVINIMSDYLEHVFKPFITLSTSDPLLRMRLLSNFFLKNMEDEKLYESTLYLIKIRNKACHGKLNNELRDVERLCKIWINNLFLVYNIIKETHLVSSNSIEKLIEKYISLVNVNINEYNAMKFVDPNIKDPDIYTPTIVRTTMIEVSGIKKNSIEIVEKPKVFDSIIEEGEFIIETDTIMNLKTKHGAEIKNKHLVIRDGKWEGEEGKIVNFSGSNVVMIIKGRKEKISTIRKISIYFPK